MIRKQNPNMISEKLSDQSWVTYGELPGDLRMNTEEYDELWESRPGFKNKINIFGKVHDIPRQQMVYGVKNYTYSGTKFECQSIPENLKQYLDWANRGVGEKENNNKIKYNMILVNWYENGMDNIGSHRDDEQEIIPHTNVMTISFGTPRIFRIRYNPKTKQIRENTNTEVDKKDYILNNNTYFVMGGNFQDEFKHEIPKQKKIKSSRISITFRKFKE